ncbi:MAG: hypothetical protein P8Z74_21000, partial [Acidobacteriota bacterium]
EKTSIDSLHSFIIHAYMFMMKYQTFFLMYQKESLKAENEICFLPDLDHLNFHELDNGWSTAQIGHGIAEQAPASFIRQLPRPGKLLAEPLGVLTLTDPGTDHRRLAGRCPR